MMPAELKGIYRGREIKFYDELMSLREALIEEFFNFHPDYQNLITHFVKPEEGNYTANAWKIAPVKITKPDWSHKPTDPSSNKGMSDEQFKDIADRLNSHINDCIEQGLVDDDWVVSKELPTAASLVKKFGKHCPQAGYSILEPGCIIKRHTGIENRDAKFVRIHIPLIIPEGDVGLEVNGEVVNWDDLFAFDNQKLHSAWNLTEQRRLVFIIDLSREICELPAGIPWDYQRRGDIPDFPKTS